VIQLYTDQSPHAWKVSVALEELELPYRAHHVRMSHGEQKRPEYLAISPWGVVPAIVDEDRGGLAVIESGAILVYLAEKAGKLLPTEPRARAQVLQWVFFHTANVGPSQGAVDVLQYEVPEPMWDAVAFFMKRTLGLYSVLDRQLAEREWLAGEFSIADIANWTYIGTAEWVGIDLAPYPNLVRWLGSMAKRPGCRRGLDVPVRLDPDSMPVGFEKYRRYIQTVKSMLDR
jgi:glutathione S-transferase